MTAIYVAAPFAARAFAAEVADSLTKAGHTVTSEWVTDDIEITPGTRGAAPDLSDFTVRDYGIETFNQIAEADVLLLLTANYIRLGNPDIDEAFLYSGGRHVEFGYAIGLRLPVLTVGEPENLFQRAFGRIFPDVFAVMEFLEPPRGLGEGSLSGIALG